MYLTYLFIVSDSFSEISQQTREKGKLLHQLMGNRHLRMNLSVVSCLENKAEIRFFRAGYLRKLFFDIYFEAPN